MIPIAGVLVTLAFLLGVLALLADMMGRHRRISEELLYLSRRRMYARGHSPVMVSVGDELLSQLSLHDRPETDEAPAAMPAPISRGGFE
jgi:hypothetical protein